MRKKKKKQDEKKDKIRIKRGKIGKEITTKEKSKRDKKEKRGNSKRKERENCKRTIVRVA